jgi:hypothetical protein
LNNDRRIVLSSLNDFFTLGWVIVP